MMDPKKEIERRLRAAEAEHDVKVLFSIESGSRAWGFASPDSDYDVRFVYVRPLHWYASFDVENRPDVIEYPIVDDFDINGWDLRKALGLLLKYNPSLIEWLHSPIIYRDDGHFASACKALLADSFNTTRAAYHYLSMARKNYREHLQADEVRLKKYLYVLRPLLTLRWLAEHRSPAPIVFDELRVAVNVEPVVDLAIDDLLTRKKASGEKERVARIEVLNEFIDSELKRWEEMPDFDKESIDSEALNAIFRDYSIAANL